MKTSADGRKNSLRDFYRAHKRLPTYREALILWDICSKNAVHKIMHNLTDCGFLEKDTGGKFAPGESFFALPLVGSVPAGFPVPDAAEVSDTLSLDQYLVDKPSSSFLLKVSGDSLKDLGILPGDLAVIEKTARAKHNDVVLARVDGEWTLKIFTLRNKSVVLLPANVAYRPIVPRHELSVYGVMKGIVRKMN